MVLRALMTMGIISAVLVLTGCGGDNGSNNNTIPPTLSLSPTTADIILGNSKPFTITATNTDFTVSGNGCIKNNNTTVICKPTSEGTHELTVTATEDTTLIRKATMTVIEIDITIATSTGDADQTLAMVG